MKINKKLIMAISFCIGAALFTTSALADISSKSGYEKFKDAIKSTVEKLDEGLNSYTAEQTITIKDNDKLLATMDGITKYDVANKKTETNESEKYLNGVKKEDYSYNDPDMSVYHRDGDKAYLVTNYEGGQNYLVHSKFGNPFKNDNEKDYEKIIDAIVGDLKEYVMVDEKSDGSTEFSGSLSEAQIPVLINAGVSFLFKQTYSSSRVGDTNLQLPQLKDNISIKNIKGKASENKDGIIDSLLISGSLYGDDKSGNSHELSLDVLITITDINSTKVNAPDLEGKKVEKSTVKDQSGHMLLQDKYIGIYKNDIVLDKGNKFVKIGEKFIEITSINGSKIKGKYYERINKGNTGYKGSINDFDFTSTTSYSNECNVQFTDTDGKIQKGYIHFNEASAELVLDDSKNPGGTINHGLLYRVFDN